MRLFPIVPTIDDALRQKYKTTLAEYRVEMLEKFGEKLGITVEKCQKLEEILLSHYSIRDQATKDYPFSRADTMKALLAPITNSVMHPLTRLAHKILNHYEIIDEPFMLSGALREKDGSATGTLCQCFYATVRFTPETIYVYSNWDDGDMCPETDANLAAMLPTPAYLAQILPMLSEIADEQAKSGDRDYNPPLKVSIKAPAPATDELAL